jgi:hypothetical protein
LVKKDEENEEKIKEKMRLVIIVDIQDVIESCTDILTTSYWLHVELGKNI